MTLPSYSYSNSDRMLAYGLSIGILVGAIGLAAIYNRAKPIVSSAFQSEHQDEFDRMPGATQIVDNMMERTNANAVLFEKNEPTLWPAGGLTVVNIVEAIRSANNLPEFPTATI
jgi:hypothetical protein